MKVSFAYVPVTGGSSTTIMVALGSKLSPLNQSFNHSGVAQPVHYARASTQTFFGRGGGAVSETFTAMNEHSNYFAAMIFTRVTLGDLRGRSGQLIYQDDASGRITLANCVCTKASGKLIGLASFTDFEFSGGVWTNG